MILFRDALHRRPLKNSEHLGARWRLLGKMAQKWEISGKSNFQIFDRGIQTRCPELGVIKRLAEGEIAFLTKVKKGSFYWGKNGKWPKTRHRSGEIEIGAKMTKNGKILAESFSTYSNF